MVPAGGPDCHQEVPNTLTKKQLRKESICLEYNSKLQSIIVGMSRQKFKHNIHGQEQRWSKYLPREWRHPQLIGCKNYSKHMLLIIYVHTHTHKCTHTTEKNVW